MANAIVCDRCEEVFPEGEFKLLGTQGMVDRDGDKIDLCRKCSDDLESFFSYEFEDIEDVQELLKLNKKKTK